MLQSGAASAIGVAATLAGWNLDSGRAWAGSGTSVALTVGWNSVVWLGEPTPSAQAFAEIPARVVFGWHVADRRWMPFTPNGPFDELATVAYAQPLWLYMTADALWTQEPPAAGPATPILLPRGWSFLSWVGDQSPVWDVFGTDLNGPVRHAQRWNPAERRYISFRPGFAADQLFAVLHPGDAFWVDSVVSDLEWSPVGGLEPVPDVEPDRQVVEGQATFYWRGLQGGAMYCGGTYDYRDPTIAAATTWPCGTQLRVWRDGKFVDVTVQDTGLLPANHVDLSEAAYDQLGLQAEGRIPVLIEVLSIPPPA
jgi:hypothetical protein